MNNKKIKKVLSMFIALSLAVCSAFVQEGKASAETKKFSVTSSYTNPEGSGTISVRSENGAVYYSNGSISERKLVSDSVAGDSDESKGEVCLGIDQYGTVWIIYKNQAMYWYNMEIIGKKGVVQKWKGADNNKEVKAIRLASNGTYSGFTTVSHYTDGKTLEDVVLPDFRTLYKAFNDGEEYSAATPTPAPTAAPTQAPTAVPTQVPPTAAPTEQHAAVVATETPFVPTRKPMPTPTEVPTLAPGATPSPTPYVVAEIDSHTTIDMVMEWWEETRKKQEAEWQILKEELSKIGAQIDGYTVTTAEETYEYDPVTKQLVRKLTTTVSNEKKQITGEIQTTGQETGQAKVEEVSQTHGLAELQGTIDTHTTVDQPNPIKIDMTGSSGTAKATKTKSGYYRTQKGKYVNLVRVKNGKSGILCKVYFDPVKKIAKFDGITYKGIDYVGYTFKSKMIIMHRVNKKVIIVARSKGKAGKIYKTKTLKYKWDTVVTGVEDLALRVVNPKKKMGVRNAQPIVVKKKAAAKKTTKKTTAKKTTAKKTTKKKSTSKKKTTTKKSAKTTKKNPNDKVTTADNK